MEGILFFFLAIGVFAFFGQSFLRIFGDPQVEGSRDQKWSRILTVIFGLFLMILFGAGMVFQSPFGEQPVEFLFGIFFIAIGLYSTIRAIYPSKISSNSQFVWGLGTGLTLSILGGIKYWGLVLENGRFFQPSQFLMLTLVGIYVFGVTLFRRVMS